MSKWGVQPLPKVTTIRTSKKKLSSEPDKIHMPMYKDKKEKVKRELISHHLRWPMN